MKSSLSPLLLPTRFVLHLLMAIGSEEPYSSPLRPKTLAYQQRIIHAMVYHTDGSLFLVR